MSRLCVHLSVCVRPCVPCARLRLAAGQSAPLIWNFKGGRYTLTPTADSSGPAQAAAGAQSPSPTGGRGVRRSPVPGLVRRARPKTATWSTHYNESQIHTTRAAPRRR